MKPVQQDQNYKGEIQLNTKFKLQALVAPRGKKILAICFFGSEYFAGRFNRSFDKNPKIIRVLLYSKKDVFGQKWGYGVI